MKPVSRINLLRYGAPTFLSAFLLFQIQPLVAKRILPWFGGTPAVWATSLFFFQALLLAGYVYAHLLTRISAVRRQALVHLSLLAASLLLLPVGPSESWKLAAFEEPIRHILALLLASVGGPVLLLATTGPLLQSWLHRADPDTSPYGLYALSNTGSLLALLSYPFAFEPAIGAATQALLWSGAYVVFVLACAGCAVGLLRSGAVGTLPLGAAKAQRPPRPSASERLSWFGLTACASVALLATTNRVCQDIAVVPLLWVVPLALYLLSFVLTFAREDGYDRRVWGPLFLVLLVLGAALPLARDRLPLPAAISLYCALLFATCMVCHGELFRRKPDPIRLTDFYLVVAAGGVAGGAFAALLAPVAFRSFAEFPLSLLGSYLLFAALVLADPASALRGGRRVGAWAGLVVFGWLLGIGYFVPGLPGDGETTSRSFYGVHRIRDIDPNGPAWQRRFVHGSTIHGVQFMRGDRRHLPLSYFGRESGIGRVLDERAAASEGGLNVGVVGLGAGTLASYGRAGDRYRFYEIDPSVVRLARNRFSFIEDSPAVVEIVLGDGRVRLEQEAGDPEHHPLFDVLVLDAFSSGAVPLHLLTAEAFDIYWARLDPEGVLAVHVSNRYVDLARVVRDRARIRGEHAVLVHSPADADVGLFPNSWVLVTRDEGASSKSAWRDAATPWPASDRLPILWTDDHSDLFRALR